MKNDLRLLLTTNLVNNHT